MPSTLANATGFTMDLGSWVRNFGSLDQTDVTVNLTITQNGTELYNETSTATPVPNNDSAFMALPLFSQTNWNGYYEGLYTVSSTNEDGFPSDNTFDFNFLADSLFTYAKVDPATKTPLQESFVRATLNTPSYQVCAYFSSPMASLYQIEGLYTGATKSGNASMDGEVLEARILSGTIHLQAGPMQPSMIFTAHTADYFYEDSVGGLTVYIPSQNHSLWRTISATCSVRILLHGRIPRYDEVSIHRIQADLDADLRVQRQRSLGAFTDATYSGLV